jgi:uncharacterized protein (DUF1499 family)
MERSKLALATAFLSGLGLFMGAVTPLFIQAGWIRPMVGFQAWAIFSLVGLIGLVLGLFAFRATAPGKKAGRSLAIFGLAAGGLIGGLFIWSAASGGDYPPINDITTDLSDPPAFSSDPADRDRDMEYPADFAAQVRSAYPDLAPIETDNDPARAVDLALQTAEGLGWEIIQADRDGGTILARQTTAIFRFVDDIVIRVRPQNGGAIVDLRSKSRDGRGDIGANAIRIRAFTEAYPR